MIRLLFITTLSWNQAFNCLCSTWILKCGSLKLRVLITQMFYSKHAFNKYSCSSVHTEISHLSQPTLSISFMLLILFFSPKYNLNCTYATLLYLFWLQGVRSDKNSITISDAWQQLCVFSCFFSLFFLKEASLLLALWLQAFILLYYYAFAFGRQTEYFSTPSHIHCLPDGGRASRPYHDTKDIVFCTLPWASSALRFTSVFWETLFCDSDTQHLHQVTD